ncbi:MAG: large subunit ribosomal protein L23 [Parcubacteria group bacterium Gr01-1014_33]|nr:MAG: large subunit ribosomal protein L23 [Parcubacteria group bacterium Gr01-1014_33]
MKHTVQVTPATDAAQSDVPIQDAKQSGKRSEESHVPSLVTGVLRRPHITEKTSNAAKENKYVFAIAAGVNKPMVTHAVESRYNVSVETVNIVNLPSKKRMRGRQIGWKQGLRKAIVQVKEGQTIEIQ